MRYFVAGIPGVLTGAAVGKIATGLTAFPIATLFACVAGIAMTWFVYSIEEALCDTQNK